ncbi:MAG: hypothetical protein CL916_10075 [Deltaproteobacteria bacterium]|nr:hypothetical protein [Deltaproteobacteria bacterium]
MIVLWLSLVQAEENWNDASRRDLHHYVRSASLDIRGHVPTIDEILSLEESEELSDNTLDEWLNSLAFEERVIDYHKELFWNKLSTQVIQRRRLVRISNIYYSPSKRSTYRGNRTHCGDFEANYDSNGQLITQELEDGSIQEGWVYATPYWAPDSSIKLCAFDAQEADFSASSGVACDSLDGHKEVDCGCGPNVQWCFDNNLRSDFTDSVAKEVEERVRKMLKENMSYDQFLVQPFAQVNGPMVHYFKYIYIFDDKFQPYVDIENLPDLAYSDKDAWLDVETPDSAQGIFSSAAWLLRHQTNRGRANRLYGAFLCSEFIPVEGKIEGLTGTELPSPDLSRREGCVDCHARLEPMAAYWARWGEASQNYIDPISLPSYSEECATCLQSNTCSTNCKNNYIVSASHPDETPYIGWLRSVAFLSETERFNSELGPSEWIYQSMADGSLAQCAASNTSRWLLGWNKEEQIQQDVAVRNYAMEFENSGYSFRSLVRTIIKSPSYWRRP